MFVLYNLLLLLASPVILAVLLAKKRCRPGLRQRLGWMPRDLDKSRDGRPTIWVHAVSLGETTAAVPLVQQLRHAIRPPACSCPLSPRPARKQCCAGWPGRRNISTFRWTSAGRSGPP